MTPTDMTDGLRVRVTRLTIGPTNATIYDERSISVRIEDDGVGEFIVIESNFDGDKAGELRVDPHEFPHVVKAFERLAAEIVEENT